MYLTWARKRALFWDSDTIHGIPMWNANPAPANDFEPSVICRLSREAVSIRRLGGSKADAGCDRRALAVLRELDVLVFRVGRGTLNGRGGFEGEIDRARSDPSDPSRRMTGSMI